MKALLSSLALAAVLVFVSCAVRPGGGNANVSPKPSAAAPVNKPRLSHHRARNVAENSPAVDEEEAGSERIASTLANAAALEEQVFGGPATLVNEPPEPEPEPEPDPPAAEPEPEDPVTPARRPGLFVQPSELMDWWKRACAGASALSQADGDQDVAKIMAQLASLLGEALHRSMEESDGKE